MFSGVINKTSPVTDVLEVLSGSWNQYKSNEWQIYHTPFFTVFTAVLDAGQHPLPFTVNVPVAGILSTNSGDVKAVVVKPLQTAVNLPDSGIVNITVYGNQAKLTAVR